MNQSNSVSSEHNEIIGKKPSAQIKAQDATNSKHTESLHRFLPKIMVVENSAEDIEARTIYETTINRISSYILSVSVLVVSVTSMIIDYFKEDYNLVAPLILLCIPTIFSLAWLKDKERNPIVPRLVLGFSLTLLCIFLVFGNGPADGSSMLWVAILPMSIVLCLGVYYGFVAFVAIYLTILLLFFTPLESYMVMTLTETMKIRVSLVCLGSFIFVWFLEYARLKTNLALHSAAYHIEKTSLTDTLTGLGNRRDFNRSINWLFARVERSHIPYSLAILDIDHFKKVNDTYGHGVGDEVLKYLANEVSAQIRTADRLFRWGGEEFAIIMPSTNMSMAMAGAERVRKHIEANTFKCNDIEINITVSLGIYSGTETSDVSIPMEIADQCLYKAKSTGRNKVVGSYNMESAQ